MNCWYCPKLPDTKNNSSNVLVPPPLPYMAASKMKEPLRSLFNTGVDQNNVVLPVGSNDSHYTLINGPGVLSPSPLQVVVLSNWKANDTTSMWLGMPPHPFALPGDYTIETTFDLTGYDTNNVIIYISCLVDNLVNDILINGVSTGLKFSSYISSVESEIKSGFVPGLNKLTFLVNNGIAGAFNPSGLRVNLDGWASRL